MTTSEATIDHLRTRLQAGQQWLTRENQRWGANDPNAATDERFSRALAGWDALERVYRCARPSGCIWSPKFCPQACVATCDSCVPQPAPVTE